MLIVIVIMEWVAPPLHQQAVKISREKQRQIEAADDISFEQYLTEYFAQS